MTKNLMPLEQVITNLGQELRARLLDIATLLALSWKLIPCTSMHTTAYQQPYPKLIRCCALACLTLASHLSHLGGKA